MEDPEAAGAAESRMEWRTSFINSHRKLSHCTAAVAVSEKTCNPQRSSRSASLSHRVPFKSQVVHSELKIHAESPPRAEGEICNQGVILVK